MVKDKFTWKSLRLHRIIFTGLPKRDQALKKTVAPFKAVRFKTNNKIQLIAIIIWPKAQLISISNLMVEDITSSILACQSMDNSLQESILLEPLDNSQDQIQKISWVYKMLEAVMEQFKAIIWIHITFTQTTQLMDIEIEIIHLIKPSSTNRSQVPFSEPEDSTGIMDQEGPIMIYSIHRRDLITLASLVAVEIKWEWVIIVLEGTLSMSAIINCRSKVENSITSPWDADKRNSMGVLQIPCNKPNHNSLLNTLIKEKRKATTICIQTLPALVS